MDWATLVSLWPGSEQQTAWAVAQAESSGNPNALGDNGNSFGLWQIYRPAHPEFNGWNLYDPAINAQAAFQVWQASGWGAWSTYKNGAYRAFLGTYDPNAAGAPALLAGLPPNLSKGLMVAAIVAAVYLITR